MAFSAFRVIFCIYSPICFSLLHQSCKKRLVLIFPVTDLRVKDESVVRGGGGGDNANCSSGEAARAQCSSAGAAVWVQISDIA